MSAEHLRLTTYFGERDRTEHGLLSDALLELYAEQRLRASVLLRGAEGFGRLHHLHTDRLLTLSEDLPAVSIALDTRARIEAVLERVLELQHRGLITLERARMPDGDVVSGELPAGMRESLKLTVFVGRRERVGGRAAFTAVTDLLHRRGVAGASVLLGVDGTIAGTRTRARFFARNAEVPAMVVAVGAGEAIAGAVGELQGTLRSPLMAIERVQVCKRDGRLLARPQVLPATDKDGLGLWQKLTVHTSQAATVDGHPINLQIIRALRESDALGATSVRGVWGFHGAHAPHGERMLQLRRHLPVLTVAIATPERIARSFEIIDELTREQGLVTSEMVPAALALGAQEQRGGLRLADHSY